MNTIKAEKYIYFDLLLTLFALAFMSYSYYGFRSIAICGIAVTVCFITDSICIYLRGKKVTAEDSCSLVTGMIIALMMPASVPYNILILTCITAIIIGKQVFGGRKNLIFSPPAVAFIFASLSWGNYVLKYPKPYAELFLNSKVSNTLFPSLSSVINSTGNVNVSDTDLILGIFTGPSGATNFIVLIVCAMVLIFRKSISAMTFLGVIGTISTFSFFNNGNIPPTKSVIFNLIGNMTIFGAIYISSDLRIVPKSILARLIYGILIGVITCTLIKFSMIENAIIYASIIVSPLSMAMDEYAAKLKSISSKFYFNKIHPQIIRLRRHIAKKLQNQKGG